MMYDTIKKKIVKLMSDMTIDSYDGIIRSRLFAYLFDNIGTDYSFNRIKDTDDEYVINRFDNNEPLTKHKLYVIETIPTINNLIKAIEGIEFSLHTHINFIVGDRIVFVVKSDTSNYDTIESISICTDRSDIDNILNIIKTSIVKSKSINDENSYKIAFKGQYSIETSVCNFNEWHSDIEKNYNDDVPYDKMNEIIRSDKSGLIMLYGIPGTGKTSIIKSLINDNMETDFIFIDSSLCESISDGQFLEFLQDNKNAVIVFEDCEKLLKDRNSGTNESMGTILNLTDGIIAESMKIKFICTFNCDINKVDKALLRKGRLSLKYEFKELSLDKTKKIYPKADKPMTLADAHNAEEKVDFSEKKKASIGFR